MEPLPDLSTLTDDDLRAMIRELEKEEDEISFRRRVLHGRIDILRAELVARLREQVSAGEAQLADVERLSEILAAKAAATSPDGGGASESRLLPRVRVLRTREASNYCSRCGALLATDAGAETTMSFDLEDDGEDSRPPRSRSGFSGPALVVRSGGGMAGQTFQPEEGRTLIGRSPECDVFLDDVTVSRRHAELVRDGRPFTIRDLGSLNGTYVNRQRIESVVLEDDDEVQIGKYRLTFLQPMSTVATRRERGGAEPRLRTIGSVCEELREQFPDISVSKIRYLEDQGLITPQADARRLPALLARRRRAPRRRSCAFSATSSCRFG